MLFGIIAKPVLHSLSPVMHQAAFRASQLNARYLRLTCNSAQEGLQLAREIGLKGVNVSAPFKSEAALLTDALEGVAQDLQAVNTVLFSSQGSLGFNTDCQGVERSFSHNGIQLQGKNALVLGAGPAGKSAAYALLKAGAKVTLANRDLNKARQVGLALDIPTLGLGDYKFESSFPSFNIIVSCLSTPNKVVASHLLRSHMILLDAWYASESCLARDAVLAGARVINGRQWLAHQGQEAFKLFCDKQVAIEVFEHALATPPVEKPGNKLALIGFMGSGKSALAKELAQLSSLRPIDLDQEIEKRAGKSIAQIFKDEGEESFRKLESEMLEQLKEEKDCVLACGGGVVLSEQNRNLLSDNFLNIWLWCPPSQAFGRLSKAQDRPLMQNLANLEQFKALLESRKNHYAEIADLVIRSDQNDPRQTALQLIDEVFSLR